MKNRIIYIFIAVTIFFSSCNNWLDVKPRNQVDREDMFSSEGGFKDALIGCYLGLKSREIYGEQLTMNAIEHLVYHWNAPKNSVEEQLNQRSYESAEVIDKMDKIYAKLYNTISRANDIIAFVDTNKSVFSNEDIRLLIKGEAIAIRAFCHLDILRLYGPVPKDLTVKKTNRLTYVKTVTYNPLNKHTYEEYIKQLEEDLINSANILKDVDPILRYSVNNLNTAGYDGVDEFSSFRRLRFNFYAVEGLKARFYLYTQQSEKAYECAMSIIKAKNSDGSNKFDLSETSDYNAEDFTLGSEHLMSLSVYNIRSYVAELFTQSTKVTVLTKTKTAIVNNVFNKSTSDRRLIKGWADLTLGNGTTINWFKKYYQSGDEASDKGFTIVNKQIIPLIRLSEIYLIAMESGSIEQCNQLAQTYYPSKDTPIVDVTEATRETQMIDEYRRNFYGEGQMFFTYKRLAAQTILWLPKESDFSLEEYVIPMPLSDIKYE